MDIVPPHGEKKVLLHSCCAPCSASVVERLHKAGIALTIFFYNPNIQPEQEYDVRKKENIRYAKKMGIPFIDADYDPERWFSLTKGHETDPERGERCSICFEMRLMKTAAYAAEHGFKVITSCGGISRWKDFDQVTRCGIMAASFFPGVTYWAHNWRAGGGAQRMSQISKEESFYLQRYCGCVYSNRSAGQARPSGVEAAGVLCADEVPG